MQPGQSNAEKSTDFFPEDSRLSTRLQRCYQPLSCVYFVTNFLRWKLGILFPPLKETHTCTHTQIWLCELPTKQSDARKIIPMSYCCLCGIFSTIHLLWLFFSSISCVHWEDIRCKDPEHYLSMISAGEIKRDITLWTGSLWRKRKPHT